jgi:hypothetical protein
VDEGSEDGAGNSNNEAGMGMVVVAMRTTTTRDARSSCSNCKTTATQLQETASSSCCQWSKNNISCYQLPVKFAVATGWVAVAVVDFQVKKPDPTGPENSNNNKDNNEDDDDDADKDKDDKGNKDEGNKDEDNNDDGDEDNKDMEGDVMGQQADRDAMAMMG